MKLNLQLGGSVESFKELQNILRVWVSKSKRSVDGHLGFGDGTNIDNIFGSWVTYTTNAVANTEDTVAHSLGMIPIGYLVFSIDKNAVLYKGGTAWDTANIYLKCSTASTTVLIFIVGNSSKDA